MFASKTTLAAIGATVFLAAPALAQIGPGPITNDPTDRPTPIQADGNTETSPDVVNDRAICDGCEASEGKITETDEFNPFSGRINAGGGGDGFPSADFDGDGLRTVHDLLALLDWYFNTPDPDPYVFLQWMSQFFYENNGGG